MSRIEIMEKLQNQKWLKISLLAVAGLLLAGGLVWAGIWYGKNSKLKAQISKPQLKSQILTPTLTPVTTSLPTLTPEAISSPAETADWKTYTDSYFKFSFKYLPGFKVSFGKRDKDDIAIKQYTSAEYYSSVNINLGADIWLGAVGPEVEGPEDEPNSYGFSIKPLKSRSIDEISLIFNKYEEKTIVTINGVKSLYLKNPEPVVGVPGDFYLYFIPISERDLIRIDLFLPKSYSDNKKTTLKRHFDLIAHSLSF